MDEPFADLSPLATFLLILLMTHMCTYKKTNRLRLHYIFILFKAFFLWLWIRHLQDYLSSSPLFLIYDKHALLREKKSK